MKHSKIQKQMPIEISTTSTINHRRKRKVCNSSESDTDLRVEKELEWPAMREVVLRRPRAGGMTTSSVEVRGTELALVDTDSSRSGWSSLRLRRRRLFLCSLKLRPLNRLIKLWETISSKRCLCFLGMKILTNMTHTQQTESQRRNCSGVWTLPCLLRQTLDRRQTGKDGGGGTAMRKSLL